MPQRRTPMSQKTARWVPTPRHSADPSARHSVAKGCPMNSECVLGPSWCGLVSCRGRGSSSLSSVPNEAVLAPGGVRDMTAVRPYPVRGKLLVSGGMRLVPTKKKKHQVVGPLRSGSDRAHMCTRCGTRQQMENEKKTKAAQIIRVPARASHVYVFHL